MEIIKESRFDTIVSQLRGKWGPVSYVLPDRQLLLDIVKATQYETGDGSVEPLLVTMTPGTGVIDLANQILAEGSRSTGACVVSMDIKRWPSRLFADSLYMGAGIMYRTVLLGLSGGTEQDVPTIFELLEGMWHVMQPKRSGPPFLHAALLVVLD